MTTLPPRERAILQRALALDLIASQATTLLLAGMPVEAVRLARSGYRHAQRECIAAAGHEERDAWNAQVTRSHVARLARMAGGA